jgi:Antibiotic biosynthesis monooxygenase
MKADQTLRRAAVGALVVTFCVCSLLPARAQAPQSRFAALLDAARAHPGCLGIDTGQMTSGKQVIFAWFENKAALVSWYKSDVHQKAMKVAFPNRTFNREPLPDTPDDTGQILAIVSLQMNDSSAPKGAGLPIATIGIELYTPVPGGVAVGGRFAPKSIRVPGLREIELGTVVGTPR